MAERSQNKESILDDPAHPYLLEHFLNVEDSEQAHCLARLIEQAELTFDFYGEEYEYVFSKQITHPAARRRDLAEIVRQAIDYYGTIPPNERDFDRAKARFQRHFPV